MKIVYRVHALERMAQRKITIEEVREVVVGGEVIEDYPADTPYPSRLMLGMVQGRPLHVVAAYNRASDETIVITAYDPDPAQWDAEFKRREP